MLAGGAENFARLVEAATEAGAPEDKNDFVDPPVRVEPTEPIPMENDEGYPQENREYLEAHPSPRNDRYDLKRFCVEGFPTIMDCFPRPKASEKTTGKGKRKKGD